MGGGDGLGVLDEICCRFSGGTFSLTIDFLSVPIGRVEVVGLGAVDFFGFLRDSVPDSIPERLGEPWRLRAEVALDVPAGLEEGMD